MIRSGDLWLEQKIFWSVVGYVFVVVADLFGQYVELKICWSVVVCVLCIYNNVYNIYVLCPVFVVADDYSFIM